MKEIDIVLNNSRRGYTLYISGEEINSFPDYRKLKISEFLVTQGLYTYKGNIGAKEFFKKYRVTPKHVCKFVNSVVYARTVAAIPKEVRSLCFERRNISSIRTFKACENIHLLEEAIKDGTRNIAPFLLSGMTTKELKKEYGNALWKELCKNSYSRNRMITQWTFDPKEVEFWNKLPTTFIKRSRNIRDAGARHWMYKINKISMKEVFSFTSSSDLNLYQDTEMMAGRLHLPFSSDWSFRKMKDKHSEYQKILNRRAYEAKLEKEERYSKPLREGKQNVFSVDGVTATVLTTYLDILEEGTNMGHCVGAFAEYCYNDQYLVVHLSGDGEESTLGINIYRIAGNKIYRFQQHYLAFNQDVVSKKHQFLAKHVIEKLNEEEENK